MKSIIITPKSSHELAFLNTLLNKLGFSTRVLSDEEKEDMGLSFLMHQVDRTKKVSKDIYKLFP